MIHIVNPEFFTLNIESVLNEGGSYSNLINIFTDPKNFDLPQYRKTPFASIVLDDNISYEKIEEKEIIETLGRASTVQYSCYTDKEYDELSNKFDPINRFHTLIFNNTKSIKNKQGDPNIVIMAIPCNGIIQPIVKSNMYKLYNGSMIVMRHRPFKWNDNYYDKLVYVMVDITTCFTFYEYVFTDSPVDIRKMITHHLSLNIDDEFGYIIPFYNQIVSYIPCAENEDRKSFYVYNGKSMFYLSDIPANVKNINGSISVKL